MQQILSNVSNIRYECQQFEILAHKVDQIQTRGEEIPRRKQHSTDENDFSSSSSDGKMSNSRIAAHTVQMLLNAGSITEAKVKDEGGSIASLREFLLPPAPQKTTRASVSAQSKLTSENQTEVHVGSSTETSAVTATKAPRDSHNSASTTTGNDNTGTAKTSAGNSSKQGSQEQRATRLSSSNKAKRERDTPTANQAATKKRQQVQESMFDIIRDRVPPKYQNDEKHLERLTTVLKFIRNKGEDGVTLNEACKEIDCTMFTTREYLSTLERSGFVEQTSHQAQKGKKSLRWIYKKQKKPRRA
eukprot:gb/GECG01011746.1/.p1 GENE.gb/GECG01011746.1/~~gb/GECG01011746.1/.p1  ORF type:complete len:302 (+),score=52.34 gb/GECG01011746.1/:1-906(+)